MADDIVTRLHDWHGPVEPSLLELVVEAIDEIERLRADASLGQILRRFLNDDEVWCPVGSVSDYRTEQMINSGTVIFWIDGAVEVTEGEAEILRSLRRTDVPS